MAIGKSGYLEVTCMPQSVGRVRVYWQENYYTEENYSTITITDIQGYLWHEAGWAYIDVKFTAGDTTVMYTNEWMISCQADTSFRSAAPRTQWDGTFTPVTSAPIYHNEDGQKAITLTFTLLDIWCNDYDGTNYLSASTTAVLTPIPRASSISATDANIESVSLVTVSKKSSSYTHTIQYRFGELTGYINSDGQSDSSASKLSSSSIGFSLPTTFYSQIPNDKTGKCTLIITTYSGDTQIGNSKSCTFTATAAQATCSPQVSGTVVDSNPTTVLLTGDENVLVRYRSNALCTISSSAVNSASVANDAISGVAVTDGTRTISGVATDSFEFLTIDSRGYSSSTTVTKQMVQYIPLTNSASASRDDPTTGNATLILSGNYFNGSFGASENELLASYRVISETDVGEHITVTPTLSGNTYYLAIPLSGLDYEQTFTIEVNVSDALDSAAKTLIINPGIPVADWGKEDFRFNKRVTYRDDPIAYYPIGAVYLSVDETDPNSIFGGTWESIEIGIASVYGWKRTE